MNNNKNGYNYYENYKTTNQNNIYNKTVNEEIKKYHAKRNRKHKIKKITTLIITLSILIPLTTYTYNYLTDSQKIEKFIIKFKKNNLADDAVTMINIIREENMMNLSVTNTCYNLNQINNISRRKITTSPFKENYLTTSYVLATINENNNYSYSVCLVDEQGNGLELTNEENVKLENVKIKTATKCVPPPGCY